MWDIEILEEGEYEISLRRWPIETMLRVRGASPPWQPQDMNSPEHVGYPAGTSIPIESAHLKVGEKQLHMDIDETASEATFRTPLSAGVREIEAYFSGHDRKPLCAAFFVTITKK